MTTDNIIGLYEEYRDMFAAFFHSEEYPDFDFSVMGDIPMDNTPIAHYV